MHLLNYRFGQKRIWTTADLDAHQKATEQTRAEWGGSNGIRGTTQAIAIGKRSLELTNEFRKKNGLPSLKWHQSLCDIGTQHSKGTVIYYKFYDTDKYRYGRRQGSFWTSRFR